MAEAICDCHETPYLSEDEIPFGRDFYRQLFNSLYDGVYFVDRSRRILFWNRSAEMLSGYTAEEVVGSLCSADILQHTDGSGCELCRTTCPLQAAIDSGCPTAHRVLLRHKDGRRIAVDVHVMPVRDQSGQIVGGVEVFRDASSLIALEDAYRQVRELAHKDALTGVANRRSLDAVLGDLHATFTRTGIYYSVILCDIDHFKQINDRWGHPAGDAVLQYFAACLQTVARRNDLVGRFGGEEFMLLMPGCRLQGAERLAQRCRSTVSRHPSIHTEGQRITASFGVTEVALGESVSSLLGRVDHALYEAKRLGRNRVVSESHSETAQDAEAVS